MSSTNPAFINFNGQILPADQPVLVANSRLARYGDGFFETIRLMNGRLNFMDRHFRRIIQGFSVLKFDADKNFTQKYLESQIHELAKMNGNIRNARVRLTCYRQGGGLYEPDDNTMGFILEIGELPFNEYSLSEKGLVMDVYEEGMKSVGELSNIKSCNALLNAVASVWKAEKGIDDCFLINAFGRLSESTGSNFFLVRSQSVYTPSLDEGCVAGVMRGVVIDICKQHSIPIIEAHLEKEDLLTADEVFLTSATLGPRWVAQYRTKKYSPAFCAGLIEKLNRFL